MRIAAFTDHLAVVLRMGLDVTPMRRGRSYWKMSTTLLRDKRFQGQLRQCWTDWNKQIKHNPTMVLWWEWVAKVHIKRLFIREGTERQREETEMETFYYACLYDALKHPLQHEERKATINRLQAKIV